MNTLRILLSIVAVCLVFCASRVDNAVLRFAPLIMTQVVAPSPLMTPFASPLVSPFAAPLMAPVAAPLVVVAPRRMHSVAIIGKRTVSDDTTTTTTTTTTPASSNATTTTQ